MRTPSLSENSTRFPLLSSRGAFAFLAGAQGLPFPATAAFSFHFLRRARCVPRPPSRIPRFISSLQTPPLVFAATISFNCVFSLLGIKKGRGSKASAFHWQFSLWKTEGGKFGDFRRKTGAPPALAVPSSWPEDILRAPRPSLSQVRAPAMLAIFSSSPSDSFPFRQA